MVLSFIFRRQQFPEASCLPLTNVEFLAYFGLDFFLDTAIQAFVKRDSFLRTLSTAVNDEPLACATNAVQELSYGLLIAEELCQFADNQKVAQPNSRFLLQVVTQTLATVLL